MPLAAQRLDHVGPSPVCRLVGGLYARQGDARDQVARYVYSLAWEQAKRRYQEGDGTSAPHVKKKRRLNAPDKRRGRDGGNET